MSDNYQILIMWDNKIPELNPVVHSDYDSMCEQARRIWEVEGNDHTLLYLEWDDRNHKTDKTFPKPMLWYVSLKYHPAFQDRYPEVP